MCIFGGKSEKKRMILQDYHIHIPAMYCECQYISYKAWDKMNHKHVKNFLLALR